MKLTPEQISLTLRIISLVDIKGADALAVADLIKTYQAMLSKEEEEKK